MKILINRQQYTLITESVKKDDDKEIQITIRKSLESIYKPLGLWKKIQDPDNNCETNYGVVGVYPHEEGRDEWSILNRFDTNREVRKRLVQIFNDDNPEHGNFITWIHDNRQKLFKGEYTDELVELNRKTIDKGNKNENYAAEILKGYFGARAEVKRFCSGDVRDTKKGMDISVNLNGQQFQVQVKPFSKVTKRIDIDGDIFYEVKSYLDILKYSNKNVQVFLFMNVDNGQYIAFENKRNKIVKTTSNTINFHEPYLITNIELPLTKKRYIRKNLGNDVFDMTKKRIEYLELKKSELEILIKKEKEKLKK